MLVLPFQASQAVTVAECNININTVISIMVPENYLYLRPVEKMLYTSCPWPDLLDDNPSCMLKCMHSCNKRWKKKKSTFGFLFLLAILLVPCFITVGLYYKTEAQANTHSSHLTDHFPLVLVCQKQQPCLSFLLNPKLTSKVWPMRAHSSAGNFLSS